ncbi:hypothetical protein D3C76_1802300 [compost metagenome]
MVVRHPSPTDLSSPDVANLAVTGVVIPLTCLVQVVLDLGVEGGNEPADDLIRTCILREIDTPG